MQREEFLARVRTAVAAGRAYQVAVNPLATADQSYVGGGADPIATFLTEWKAVGGFGERVVNREAVLEYLSRVLEQHSVRSALMWNHPVLESLQISPWLAARGIEVRHWADLEQLPAEEVRRMSFSSDLGITSVDWAVAETGSLAVCSGPGGRGRSVSLLPPLHIAIITSGQLVPDLFDLFQALGPAAAAGELPSNVTLITGPSKTGDIQLKLTTGVHGPGEVHAVVLDEIAATLPEG